MATRKQNNGGQRHNFLPRIGLLSIGLLVLALSVGRGLAQPKTDVNESQLPPPAQLQIDFDRDIKPLFESICFRCHGTERPRSGFSLVTREAALKGGDNGIDIIPGQSGKSPLIHYVSGVVSDLVMPPEAYPRLTPEQIGLLRAWIDQGPNWSTNAPKNQLQFAVSPTLRWIGVSGSEAKFRELYWTQDGWSGGLGQFQLKQTQGVDRSVTVEGHAIPNQEDYQIALTLEQRNLGFTRFGFEEYRKYYNDVGGYYPGFDPAAFTLDRGLHLDIGRAWVDFGLTLPHWPRLVIGYEYQFKEGDKSTLQWGDVSDGVDTKKIYPAAKDLEEKVHILKLDVSHTLGGVQLEDNFRVELYDLDNSRANVIGYQLGKSGPDKLELSHEQYHHVQAANTFRAEKQINDWLFASAGYLYSHLEGDVGFRLDTVLTPYAALPPVTGYGFDKLWFSQHIILSQQSHFFNANTLLGPWQGLSFSAGVQSQWMQQRGFGNVRVDEGDPTDPANIFVQPAILRSDIDKVSTSENFGLRYTQIPYTVLFADARLQQESIGQFEEQDGGLHDFLRNTDATTDLKEYRTGFSVSPWQRVSFNAHFKSRDNRSDYDHLADITRFNGLVFPGDGYPAFIRARQIATDETAAKLVFRPAAWLKTTWAYQQVATDYRTTTDPVPRYVSPGGQVFAGHYDAHVYSLNTVLTPWRRIFLSTTFSYRDTRTTTAQNGVPFVVPYRGDVYSILASATYALSQTADVQANYSFSRADYGQNNLAGVPYGAVYDWHGLQIGLTRRFKKNLTANLQYAFYTYDEPATGQFNNFTAHGVYLTLTKRFP